MNKCVYMRGAHVGTCTIEKQGLYWVLHCVCQLKIMFPVRLYCGGHGLGVLMPKGSDLVLDKMLSKSIAPNFELEELCVLMPTSRFVLNIEEYCICGDMTVEGAEKVLYVPVTRSESHPCLALMCFWRLYNGFWVLKLDENNHPLFA